MSAYLEDLKVGDKIKHSATSGGGGVVYRVIKIYYNAIHGGIETVETIPVHPFRQTGRVFGRCGLGSFEVVR